MSRIPLATVDDESEDQPELPCECCGEPTTYRVSSTLDDLTPCCGRLMCRDWVYDLLTGGING